MSLSEPWWRNKVNYINYGTQCLSRFALRKKEMPICQKVQIVHVWHASYMLCIKAGAESFWEPVASKPSQQSQPLQTCEFLRSAEDAVVVWGRLCNVSVLVFGIQADSTGSDDTAGGLGWVGPLRWRVEVSE